MGSKNLAACQTSQNGVLQVRDPVPRQQAEKNKDRDVLFHIHGHRCMNQHPHLHILGTIHENAHTHTGISKGIMLNLYITFGSMDILLFSQYQSFHKHRLSLRFCAFFRFLYSHYHIYSVQFIAFPSP